MIHKRQSSTRYWHVQTRHHHHSQYIYSVRGRLHISLCKAILTYSIFGTKYRSYLLCILYKRVNQSCIFDFQDKLSSRSNTQNRLKAPKFNYNFHRDVQHKISIARKIYTCKENQEPASSSKSIFRLGKP